MKNKEKNMSNKINNFEEYGFTGDFEGEILKKIGSEYFGWVRDTRVGTNNVMTWSEDGEAYLNDGLTIEQYCLNKVKE